MTDLDVIRDDLLNGVKEFPRHTVVELVTRVEQAERERDGASLESNERAEKWMACEDRLAKVPALVEALRKIRDDFPEDSMAMSGTAMIALEAWEQE